MTSSPRAALAVRAWFARASMFALLFLAGAGVVATDASAQEAQQSEPAAEAGAPTVDASSGGAAAFDFAETRWRVVGVGGKAVTMAGDLHFEAGGVDGASACNFFGGAFETGPDQALVIKVDRMTRRGCSGDALELERAYLDALGSVRSYRFEDAEREKLVFLDESGATIAELARKHGFQLEGTPLKIVSYLFEDGLYSVKPGSKVTIRFAGGRMEGDTGCSLFSGHYDIAETTVKITLDMAVPKSEKCAEDLQQQDQAILAALEAAARYDVGRNVIRFLQAERDWAVLWLAQDTDPQVPAGEERPEQNAGQDPAADASAAGEGSGTAAGAPEAEASPPH